MNNSLPSSTQPQRDSINAYRRAHNESHKMLPDGRMQIKLYSRFDNQKTNLLEVAFVERNGSVSYGREPLA